MKTKILAALAFLFCASSAFATDYSAPQCPVGGPFNPYPAGQIGGTAGPSNCDMGSGQVTATFSDTLTFGVGNWTESYGVWTYTSTKTVNVTGVSGVEGRYNHFSVVIDSASLDGVPLVAPVSGLTWTMGVDLTPGVHVVAVSGHTTGVIWQGSRWGVAVEGLLYTLEALPPRADCGE